MVIFTNPRVSLNKREEERFHAQLFLDIRAFDELEDQAVTAHSTDLSDSGIGLITHKTYPIGTRLLISKDGQFIALGEVVNMNEEWDSWDWCGIDRMGVRLIEKKNNWPLQ